MVASFKGQHGILCDEATKYDVYIRLVYKCNFLIFISEQAGVRFNLKALPPIMVKGKSDPIPIYIPTRLKERSSNVQQGSRLSTEIHSLFFISQFLRSINTLHRRSQSNTAIPVRETLCGREAEKALLYEQLESLGI